MWHFLAELYKFTSNFMTDNWSTECNTELRQGVCDFLFYFRVARKQAIEFRANALKIALGNFFLYETSY